MRLESSVKPQSTSSLQYVRFDDWHVVFQEEFAGLFVTYQAREVLQIVLGQMQENGSKPVSLLPSVWLCFQSTSAVHRGSE